MKPDGLLAHKYRAWAVEHPNGEPLPLSGISLEELTEHCRAALLVVTRRPEDYRPQLTAEETQMIASVSAAFERSVLILNTPGYMELGEAARSCAAVVFMTFAGQNYGARNTERIYKSIRAGLVLHVTFSVSYSLLLFFLREPAIRLFCRDEDVVAQGVRIVTYIVFFYPAFSCTEIFSSAMARPPST